MLQEVTSMLVKKQGLQYPVLCDQGNHVASKFGLVFTLADSMQPLYNSFGIDIPATNGDNSYQLPLPATYILDRNGIIRFSFIDVDHTTRLDPEIMIQEIAKLE